MNLFDGLQRTAQTVVETTMGYDASWTPLAGGPAITGRVLFNRPTQKAQISDQEYEDFAPKMEYFEGLFPGLLESVRRNASEPITINGNMFITLKGEKKFDGKTIIITLSDQ